MADLFFLKKNLLAQLRLETFWMFGVSYLDPSV